MTLETNELTEDQIRARLDRLAIARYAISGRAFVELVRSGQVDEECGGSADLVALVRLLPEGAFSFVR